MNLERRILKGIEFRKSGSGQMLSGYAVKWGTLAQIKGFKETFVRGAFAQVLGDPKLDCRFLAEHDPAAVMGRTIAGTLRLREDNIGLYYEVDLPDTQAARDLYTSVQRGDITQSSFGFGAAPNDCTWTETREGVLRTVNNVQTLFDVSAVTYPAYQSSTVEARSKKKGIPEHIKRQFNRVTELRRSGRQTSLWQDPFIMRDCPAGHELRWLVPGTYVVNTPQVQQRRRNLLDSLIQ